ncbi:MAG: tetratricopeptide repeat protein [Proteobacteria bacterium]|nr:tetratricopeptide repeat protein [Pseudomonadota bacterium]
MTTVRRVFLVCCLAGVLIFLLLTVAHAQETESQKVLKEYPEVGLAIEQKILDYPTLTKILELNQQGQYGKAIPLVEDVLKKSENVLGPEHAFTATAKNFLATLYVRLGNYSQAEPIQKQALDVRRTVLGPEHPHTVTSIDNLAKIYFARGSYDQALPLFQQVVTFAEKVLGPEHPQTAAILNTQKRRAILWLA